MKRRAMILAMALLPAVSTSAADRGTGGGVSEVTRYRHGVVEVRSETPPVRSLLPQSVSDWQPQRKAAVPNSGLLDSYVRWISGDAAAIGQDVATGALGEDVLVGWNLNNTRVSFHDNASNVPAWEFVSDPQTYRNFVALSADGGVVANASYHHIYLFDKATGAVTFDVVPEADRIAGPIAVTRDGSLIVCATIAPSVGVTHRVYAFAPPSAVPLWTFDFSDEISSGVYGITISTDKSAIAVNGKFYGWILNAADGSVRSAFGIDNTESRIALNRDAAVMAIAENSGFIKTYTWNAGQARYDLLWRYKIPVGAFSNWASAVDLSADGLTLMAGTLLFTSGGYDGSVYLFDTFGDGIPLWVYGGTGDMVDEVALSDDGSIGSAVTWGDQANSQPDILIFERGSNTPIFTVTTNGSMFSLAMSADGRTVVAGGKAVHARQFGNGGNIYNIAVDPGGGSIAGTVTLTGAPHSAGARVGVVGTTRSAVTDSLGRYVVNNVPAGTQTVRFSALGYVATSLAGVIVIGADTVENVDATLTQSGSPPTGLLASQGLNSRIELVWTNPSLLAVPAFDRELAVDPSSQSASIAARGGGSVLSPAVKSPPLPPLLPDSIRVYRAIRPGGPYFVKATLPGAAAAFTDSTAVPLKNYFYTVTALYGEGESVYSNEAFGSVDSSFLRFSITAPHRTVSPVIDGEIAPGEWSDALQVDISDVFGYGGGVPLQRGSVFMYIKIDSALGRLYIAGEDFLNADGLSDGEGFGLYFDDNNDGQFGEPGGNPLVREGNYWAYFYGTGALVRFRELYGLGAASAVIDTVTDAQVAASAATGHFVGEVSIPLSFLNKNHLQVFGPDHVVAGGLFMISRVAGTAVFHGWWPQTMASVFSASGFGDIRIPVRLVAPPKAPTNLTVSRQANNLVLSWDDPVEGLNNEPFTVPVDLDVESNGRVATRVPLGVRTFTDSSLVPKGWYEYRIRGSIDIPGETRYFGPYSQSIGAFAVNDPELFELSYDDGGPEAFYVVDFNYDGNKFGIRFTPRIIPSKVYRVRAFTNNGNSPIMVSIHEDSSGYPGPLLAGPYPGESYQVSGLDSFTVTVPGGEPPTLLGGDFHVVLSYLPTSPGAPGIGGDFTAPIDQRSAYFTNASGWVPMTAADLIVRAFVEEEANAVGEEPELPLVFELRQNYPNPFNPVTTIQFTTSEGTYGPASTTGRRTSLQVFDLLGREVATLVDGEMEPGRYTVKFDASNLGTGVYMYRLTAGSFVAVRKLMVLK